MTREELSMALTHAEVGAGQKFSQQRAKNEAFIVKCELYEAFSFGSEDGLSTEAAEALRSTRAQFALTRN